MKITHARGWHLSAHGLRPYGIGLAVEQPRVRGRELGFTNNMLTYPLADMAVLVIGTAGPREFAEDFRNDAPSERPGDARALTAGLRWFADGEAALR
jgi:hypothetical protein